MMNKLKSSSPHFKLYKRNLRNSSPESSSEEKSPILSLICLITFFSMYLHSFRNTCGS